MKLKTLTATVALVAGFLVTAFPIAATAQTYTIYGAGTFSCGRWLQDRQARDDLVALNTKGIEEGWVLGFITGTNASNAVYASALGGKSAESKTVGVKEDPDGMFAYIDNYCRTQPLNTLHDAAFALFTWMHSIYYKPKLP